MTKWLLPLLLLAGSSSYAQVSGPTIKPLVASDFGRWTVSAQTPVNAAGAAGVFLQSSTATASAGPQFSPATSGTPLLIIDPGHNEIVVPANVSCPMGGTTCQFIATFAQPHPGSFSVSSGTYGLQEAINYLLGTGGTVQITSDWGGSGSMITGATGSAGVSIQDVRNGLNLYTWNGMGYVLQIYVSSTTANTFTQLNQFLAGILVGPSTFAALGTPVDGVMIYCTDCQQQNPCIGGGSGAFASRVGGAWQCAAGGGGGGGISFQGIASGGYAIVISSSIIADGGFPVTNCASGHVNAYYDVAGKVVKCDTSVTDDGSGNTGSVSHKAGGLTLLNGGLYKDFPNANPGTGSNLAVCSNSLRQAVTCPTTTTTGVRGTTVTGGNAGNAAVCILGSCPVIFDNVATAGHSAIPSTSAAGQYHDTGSTADVAATQTFWVSQGGGTASPGTVGSIDIFYPEQDSATGTSNNRISGTLLAGQIAFGSAQNTIQGTSNATLDTSGVAQLAGVVTTGSNAQVSFPNTNDATGTHAGKLVRIGASGQIIETTTSDTAVLVYPVTPSLSQNGNVVCAPGTTGNGCPASLGHISVTFDASGGTIHHFVGQSTTTGAVAKDLGAALPAGPICIMGELLTSAGASGSGVVDVHPFCYPANSTPSTITSTGAGGSTTVTATWEMDLDFAECTAASTSQLTWDVPPGGTTATAGGCNGTNVNQGYANFSSTGTPTLERSFRLPQTLTGTADIYFTYLSAATAATFTPVMDMVCVATNGSATNDPSFTANNFFAPGSQSTPGTTLRLQTVSVTAVAWPAGCTGGTMAHVRFLRNDGAGAASVSALSVHIVGRRTF